MKKRTRVLAAFLTVTMVLPVTACKKKEQQSQELTRRYKSGQEIKETDPYFNAEINTIKLPIDEEKELRDVFISDCSIVDGLAIVSYYISYALPEGVSYEDLSYEQGKEYTVDSTGLFDEKGNFIREISENGNIVLFDIATDNDGNACMLIGSFNREKGKFELQIEVVDHEGEIVKTVPIEQPPFDPTESGRSELNILSDGRFTISGDGNLMVYDEEGQKCFEISDLGRDISESIITEDGKSYVVSGVYDFGEDIDIQIKEVNMETGELGKGVEANYLMNATGLQENTNGLFTTTVNGCYKVDMKNKKLVQFFDWNDTDIRRDLLQNYTCVPMSEDELYMTCTEYSMTGSTLYLIHLTRAEKNPHAGKKLLVIGGSYLDYNEEFTSFIADYNKDPNHSCRAVYVDYSEGFFDSESYLDLERQVYLDIVSGEGPDILLNFSGSAPYQTDLIMEDLNPYLDGANGINRDEYFDNIIRAQERDGKLYHIPLRVSLAGFEINTNYIPAMDGWNFDEFDAAASAIPENVSFLESQEYSDFLSMLLYATLPQFVDYKNKTVDFENDTMKKYLQMAKKYGVKEIPSDEGMDLEYAGGGTYYGGEDRTDIKFCEGLLAAKLFQIADLMDYCLAKEKVGGNTAFIGYPSLENGGMEINSYLSIGIVATSKQKDLAWELIRAYLEYSPDGEVSDMAFSVNRAAFEKECEDEMNRLNNYYQTRLRDADVWDFDGIYTEIHKEDIDSLRLLMEQANTVSCYDDAIIEVIMEESAAYFAGDRSEEEVLKNIQNRTATILKEL
ncbi:MAG: extracellular solute-binding protein [Clostridiales bacterium]|nr:extracellular solute-binding protein [Clostridiales bacterium]